MTSTARSTVTGRSVAITLVAALAVAVLVVLGVWQWQRGHVVVTEPPAQQAAIGVEQVVSGAAAPGTAQGALSADEVGRNVTVTGTFDPAVDLRVAARRLDGRPGAWSLGIVRAADGTGVPVVRGWVPEGQPAPPPPPGEVTIDGVVQAPEGTDVAATTRALAAGEVNVVSAALLVNRVDYRLANAYVTATAPAAGLLAVPPVDPGEATRRLDWGNLAYAAQWWVFAAFTVVVWWRALRDDRVARDAVLDAGAPDVPHPETADPDVPGPGGRADMSSAR